VSSTEGATWHNDLAPIGELLWECGSGGDVPCHAEMMSCVKRIWHM
jgi:hypothetical protein